MKTFKTSVAAALIFAAMFSSCKKDDVKLVANGSPEATDGVTAERGANSVVHPAGSKIQGMTYGEWGAMWWKWALELPPVANHPFYDDPGFDVTMGQSGKIWFLAGVMPGTVTRTCTIPHGTSLMIALTAAEASDLEGYGTTYLDLLQAASTQADGIANVFCIIDGNPLPNASDFRVISPAPPFTFNAPTPWVFGTTGGAGMAVSDGYFMMLKPFSRGTHVLRFGGQIPSQTLSSDMTYNITVE